MPKISVIVPIYNVEKYLQQCLDSILVQSLQDLEIICIDDGSTDNSVNILDEISVKDSRVKVVHKENAGYGVLSALFAFSPFRTPEMERKHGKDSRTEN